MPVHVYDAGGAQWQDTSELSVWDGGTSAYRLARGAWVRDAGVWKKAYERLGIWAGNDFYALSTGNPGLTVTADYTPLGSLPKVTMTIGNNGLITFAGNGPVTGLTYSTGGPSYRWGEGVLGATTDVEYNHARCKWSEYSATGVGSVSGSWTEGAWTAMDGNKTVEFNLGANSGLGNEVALISLQKITGSYALVARYIKVAFDDGSGGGA